VLGVVGGPSCGYETGVELFKPPKKSLMFRFYAVGIPECLRCHEAFNRYGGMGMRRKRLESVSRVKTETLRASRWYLYERF